jgi:hypothetical protein
MSADEHGEKTQLAAVEIDEEADRDSFEKRIAELQILLPRMQGLQSVAAQKHAQQRQLLERWLASGGLVVAGVADEALLQFGALACADMTLKMLARRIRHDLTLNRVTTKLSLPADLQKHIAAFVFITPKPFRAYFPSKKLEPRFVGSIYEVVRFFSLYVAPEQSLAMAIEAGQPAPVVRELVPPTFSTEDAIVALVLRCISARMSISLGGPESSI